MHRDPLSENRKGAFEDAILILQRWNGKIHGYMEDVCQTVKFRCNLVDDRFIASFQCGVKNRLAPACDQRQDRFKVRVGRRESALSNFIQIRPFKHVQDIEKALRFFVEILGFEVPFRMGNYAYLERDTAGFRLLEQHGEDGAPPGNRRFAYYIDVRDVDRLYAELKPKLDTLPKADIYGPVNQSYGQRELLVLAPDGNLIALDKPFATTRARLQHEPRSAFLV